MQEWNLVFLPGEARSWTMLGCRETEMWGSIKAFSGWKLHRISQIEHNSRLYVSVGSVGVTEWWEEDLLSDSADLLLSDNTHRLLMEHKVRRRLTNSNVTREKTDKLVISSSEVGFIIKKRRRSISASIISCWTCIFMLNTELQPIISITGRGHLIYSVHSLTWHVALQQQQKVVGIA